MRITSFVTAVVLLMFLIPTVAESLFKQLLEQVYSNYLFQIIQIINYYLLTNYITPILISIYPISLKTKTKIFAQFLPIPSIFLFATNLSRLVPSETRLKRSPLFLSFPQKEQKNGETSNFAKTKPNQAFLLSR